MFRYQISKYALIKISKTLEIRAHILGDKKATLSNNGGLKKVTLNKEIN